MGDKRFIWRDRSGVVQGELRQREFALALLSLYGGTVEHLVWAYPDPKGDQGWHSVCTETEHQERKVAVHG